MWTLLCVVRSFFNDPKRKAPAVKQLEREEWNGWRMWICESEGMRNSPTTSRAYAGHKGGKGTREQDRQWPQSSLWAEHGETRYPLHKRYQWIPRGIQVESKYRIPSGQRMTKGPNLMAIAFSGTRSSTARFCCIQAPRFACSTCGFKKTLQSSIEKNTRSKLGQVVCLLKFIEFNIIIYIMTLSKTSTIQVQPSHSSARPKELHKFPLEEFLVPQLGQLTNHPYHSMAWKNCIPVHNDCWVSYRKNSLLSAFTLRPHSQACQLKSFQTNVGLHHSSHWPSEISLLLDLPRISAQDCIKVV